MREMATPPKIRSSREFAIEDCPCGVVGGTRSEGDVHAIDERFIPSGAAEGEIAAMSAPTAVRDTTSASNSLRPLEAVAADLHPIAKGLADRSRCRGGKSLASSGMPKAARCPA